MRLLAVDPSLRATGWAVFDDGRLTMAHVLTTGEAPPAVALHRIGQVLQWRARAADLVVTEFPRIYGHKGSKGADPNDLLWVAAVAGVAAGCGHEVAQVVTPSEWKGQSKKEKTRRLVLEALDRHGELEVFESLEREYGHLAHNGVDAIGIGLYYLKRAGKNASIKEST